MAQRMDGRTERCVGERGKEEREAEKGREGGGGFHGPPPLLPLLPSTVERIDGQPSQRGGRRRQTRVLARFKAIILALSFLPSRPDDAREGRWEGKVGRWAGGRGGGAAIRRQNPYNKRRETRLQFCAEIIEERERRKKSYELFR